MAALTTLQMVAPATAGPTFVAASGGGDTLKAGDRTYLIVRNGSGAPITVTVARFPNPDAEGMAETGLTVSVPATTGERWIGPLYGSRYRNPSTDNVEVTYSGVTSLTVAAVST